MTLLKSVSRVLRARSIGAAALVAAHVCSNAATDSAGLTVARPSSGGALFVLERDAGRLAADSWQRPTLDLYKRAVTLPGPGFSLTQSDDPAVRTAFSARGVTLGDVPQLRPWEVDLNAAPPQEDGAATAWLHWDGSERHAAVVALRRRYGADDGRFIGADLALPLGGPGVKLRAEALVSFTTAAVRMQGTQHREPALSEHQWQVALSQEAEAFESSLTLTQTSGERPNERGALVRAGVRQLEGGATLVWRDGGLYDKLGLYAFSTATRTLDDSIKLHDAVRSGLYLEAGNELRLTGELAAERLRTQPQGPLLTERYLHLGVEAGQVSSKPSLFVTLDVGRLVDATADKPGPGIRFNLEGVVPLSARGTLGLFLQRQLDHESGNEENFAELELTHAPSPGIEWRLRGMQHHASGGGAFRENEWSLWLSKTWSRSRALYAGITTTRREDESARPGRAAAFYVQVVHRIDP